MTHPALRMPWALALALALLAGCRLPQALRTPAKALPVISTRSLLAEMTDLDRLTRLPEPAYKTVQFSSYDRLSTAPYEANWMANCDGFGKEQQPNFLAVLRAPGSDGIGDYLMVDQPGPGALVRSWAPSLPPEMDSGRLRVYLDDAAEPLYDGKALDFLRRHYQALRGTVAEPASGFTLLDADYFPLAFAKRLKIVWTGNLQNVHFYHFGVRIYAPGTAVQSFSRADLQTCQAEIAAAEAALRQAGGTRPNPAGGTARPIAAAAAAGQRAELLRIEGAAAIHELRLKVTAADPAAALRQVELRGYFDGAGQPQVQAPLGDFFCSAPGPVPQATLPIAVEPDGTLICRFVMPFRKLARFEVWNHGAAAVQIEGVASVAPYTWSEGRSLHFFAKWRVDHDLTATNGDDCYDLPFLCAHGTGQLVGTAILLVNPTDMLTLLGGWWGEGDEKIWVDDDRFPSTFGTGSEDYFNYSWSAVEHFQGAYGAQPLVTGPGNRGFTVNTRWHIMDPIPFRQNIAFFMELLHHSQTPGFSYARIVYYYATPQTRDDMPVIPTGALLRPLSLPDNYQPRGAFPPNLQPTFIQAETALAAGQSAVETLAGSMWSAGRLLQWKPARAGETLALTVEPPAAGSYTLYGVFALAPGGGRVRATLNGAPLKLGSSQALARPIDLAYPHRTIARLIEMGVAPLHAGPNTLELVAEAPGTPTVAQGGGGEIGLDLLTLVPLPN